MENILLPKVVIFFQIVFIDIVMAADNAIIIGLIASSFASKDRKRIIIKVDFFINIYFST